MAGGNHCRLVGAQVTQALGRSVVRTLGYVEQPGVSLKIILEADDGSVLRLRSGGRLDCEFGVRLYVYPRHCL